MDQNDVSQSAPVEAKPTEPVTKAADSIAPTPNPTAAPMSRAMSARFAVAQICKRNVAMNWVCLIGMVATIASPYLYLVYFRIGIVFMALVVALLFLFMSHSLFLNAKLMKKYGIKKEDFKKERDDYDGTKGSAPSSS